MENPIEIPETLGACVDLLYDLREQRRKIEAQAAAIEEQERALRDHLIRELPANDARGVVGQTAKATITTSIEPTAKDWDAIYRHIVEGMQFDLLQRRLNGAACRARWDDGIEIPGVEQFRVKKISLTKV